MNFYSLETNQFSIFFREKIKVYVKLLRLSTYLAFKSKLEQAQLIFKFRLKSTYNHKRIM